MKIIYILTLLLGTLLATLFASVSVGLVGAANVETDPVGTAISNSQDILSSEEIAGLLFMREEEKLARDLYLRLYELWDLQIFIIISKSETTHMEHVLYILSQFGLEDPAANKCIGEFSNPDLQVLFDQLIVLGSQSLSDALNVGAAIEEIDILDLEQYISQTINPEVIFDYEDLTKGSRNHLRSFIKTLKQQTGETYTPQYLSFEYYSAIVSSDIESGGRSLINQFGHGKRNERGN